MTSKKATDPQDFETALTALEQIVTRMESGEQSLEQTMADFEKGMALSKQCQENLAKAELRIEKVMKKGAASDFVTMDMAQEGSSTTD